MNYKKTTNDVMIDVTPVYAENYSVPEENRFIWAYFIKIHNNTKRIIQLISRHWIITDGRGHKQEVRGPGVVGNQPVLYPGEMHEYDSAVDLKTESGFMEGSFFMQYVDGEREFFEVKIPVFALDTPFVKHVIN